MRRRLSRFFTPDPSSPMWVRLMPYGTLAFAALMAFALMGAGWEYTNTSEFCGTQCHTMPPEYISYQQSPHANVKCVECHIGRTTIATQFTRKAQDISHIVKFLGTGYEMPIYSKKLRPASQVCERCHNPSKFSPNSLETITRFDADANNAERTTYLSFKVGGGTEREGRGKGIHWHIENEVEYIFTDDANLQQEIPWVRVTSAATGETKTYTDTEAVLPPDFVANNPDSMRKMDCITCHNRASHEFKTPEDTVDDAMARELISPTIPYFKQNAVAVFERQYPNMDEAMTAVRGLDEYYATNWADYYAENEATVKKAVAELETLYSAMVFPTMDVSWTSHPDNLGHKNAPGCFRCHDGKHLDAQNESIRIECNLCHSIPVQAPKDGATPVIPLTEALEPESHTGSNWIAQHRYAFDNTCKGCHDVSDPGGIQDTSFCGNSNCHATEWKYAGLSAPQIISLSNQIPAHLPSYPAAPLTWDDLIGPILEARCTSCHGGTAGLEMETYAGLMAGGNRGATVTPGDAERSLLVQLQNEGHPNRLPPNELEWMIEWINAGAPESTAQGS